jgi:hypothetical protein
MDLFTAFNYTDCGTKFEKGDEFFEYTLIVPGSGAARCSGANSEFSQS